MSDHLDLDGLADVLAGVAAPEHLDDCPSCRARLAELSAALPAVSASLTALPQPPEPPHLDSLVTAALATARVEQQPTAAPADVVPLAGRRTRSPLLWKAAAGVAAAAVVVAGVVLVAQRGGHDSSQQASRTGYTVSSTGTDYAAGASALSRQLPALLAGTARAAAPVLGMTGTAGAPASKQQLSPMTAPTTDSLAALRTTTGLAQCLAALSDPGQPGIPLALDYARYHGVPALVVVLPSSKTDKVDVFVVGAGCNQVDAKLLFFARLPRP